jgi:hypothetical protein
MHFDKEAFSSGQVLSKLWMAETLEKVVQTHLLAQPRKILCLAGWYGITNFILRTRNQIEIEIFRSIDIDPSVESVADNINKAWEWQNWQFKGITADANDYYYGLDQFDTVINTSVEHLESRKWFDNIPCGCLVVLQSNNMPHQDHNHTHTDLNKFIEDFVFSKTLFSGEKLFVYPEWQFKRFMIIGIK